VSPHHTGKKLGLIGPNQSIYQIKSNEFNRWIVPSRKGIFAGSPLVIGAFVAGDIEFPMSQNADESSSFWRQAAAAN
jgi:hypothetical protein